eukprot:4895059-Amphidinium_carterae.1
MLLSAIVWKPRKDVMKLLRGNSKIGASNGPQAEDTKQSSDAAMLASVADSTDADPLEHGDNEGVITMPSQQTGSIQTVLVLPAPETEGDDASSSMTSELFTLST